MEYLLKHCPDITAVFAMSDLMALGAIRALNDHMACVIAAGYLGFGAMTVLRWGATAPRADHHPPELGTTASSARAEICSTVLKTEATRCMKWFLLN